MATEVDYYVAALLHAIEQSIDPDIEEEGVALLEQTVLSYWSRIGLLNKNEYFISKDLLEEAIKILEKSNYFTISRQRFGGNIFYIVSPQKLFDLFSENMNDPFNRLYDLKDSGEEWLSKALLEIDSKYTAPNSINSDSDFGEEPWQPLPIDREDPVFIAGITAVEAALDDIEADNGFAANYPDERNAIIANARGTLEGLKGGAPSKDQIKSNLIKPFQWISEKFAGGLLSAAAKTVWEFGLKLIGI